MDCKHGYTSVDEINDNYESDIICQNCIHNKFRNGIMYCDYIDMFEDSKLERKVV